MSHYDDIDREIDRDLGIRKAGAGWHPLRPFNKIFRLAWKLLRPVAKVLFFPTFSPLGTAKHYDGNGDVVIRKRTWPWRIVDALVARIVLTPVLLGLFLLTLVWLTTHPAVVQATQTPQAYGLYYRKITLATTDGLIVSAWYLPALTAGDVVLNGNAALEQKFPAAVLCHGLGYSHDQYLPLAAKLHEAGFAVLMLDLRGQGESPPSAVTFGLRERFDVVAAINHLRSLQSVDANKICLVGYGMGAAAVLNAAALDQSVAAVVVDGVWPSFSQWSEHAFDQPGVPESFVGPMFATTFDVMLREHTNQLDLEPLVRALGHQPLLFVARDTAGQAPVKDIFTLASATTGPHRVIVLDDGSGAGVVNSANLDTETAKFLVESLHWVSPGKRMSGDLKKLMDAHVGE
jgi:pimeloyl-ACP methyl ester carboxylesterase